jgi:hypothetical protein
MLSITIVIFFWPVRRKKKQEDNDETLPLSFSSGVYYGSEFTIIVFF